MVCKTTALCATTYVTLKSEKKLYCHVWYDLLRNGLTFYWRSVYTISGGSPTVPSGLPSAAYYRRFVGCIDYVRLGTSSSAPATEPRKQRLDLVADRDAHDTLAFCDDDA